MTAYVTCIYDDTNPESYSGMQLSCPGYPKVVFNTGRPTVDYLTAGAVASHRLGDHAIIMGSSSIDHFVMDGGENIDVSTPEQDEEAIRLAIRYLDRQGDLPFSMKVEACLVIPDRGINVGGSVTGAAKVKARDILTVTRNGRAVATARVTGFEFPHPPFPEGKCGLLLVPDNPIYVDDVLQIKEPHGTV